MSLPTWANRPVIGAMKPMLSSSARAGVATVSAAASAPPSNKDVALRESPLDMGSPSRFGDAASRCAWECGRL